MCDYSLNLLSKDGDGVAQCFRCQAPPPKKKEKEKRLWTMAVIDWQGSHQTWIRGNWNKQYKLYSWQYRKIRRKIFSSKYHPQCIKIFHYITFVIYQCGVINHIIYTNRFSENNGTNDDILTIYY